MRHPSLLALLLACLVVGPAVAQPDGPSSPTAGQRMAVVSMTDLLSQHPRISSIEETFKRAQDAAQKYADEENRSLRDLKAEIEMMQRNNPVRRGKEKQFLAQSEMLKFEIEWRRDEALREYMKSLEGLYAEIQALVARYARENGIDVVLQAPPQKLEAADLNDFFAKVQLRTVVFHEPVLDITAKIHELFPKPGDG